MFSLRSYRMFISYFPVRQFNWKADQDENMGEEQSSPGKK